MSSNYLNIHPPTKLLATGLVVRKKTTAGYLYRSNLEEVARTVLPRISPASAARLILARLG